MITIKWRCLSLQCRCHRPTEPISEWESLVVPSRGRVEDVARYMELLRDLVGRDHGVKSPACSHDKVDLCIPVSDKPEARIGDG